ncbi:hypothetical protein LR48_Vigan11g015900 [Vigna angularis]|uniref:Uncharacterized protein n=1 Tax=Phaseolus angularis TaxID=3914 RepID=A0A0L9VQF6_PHAAN|nr:hypothetical protein LR48_Vigan11g015900 [Vigna angularis]
MKESLRPQNSLQAQWHRGTNSTSIQCTPTSPPLRPPPTCGRTAVPTHPTSSLKWHSPLSKLAPALDLPPDCAAPHPLSPVTTATVATATKPKIHLPPTM